MNKENFVGDLSLMPEEYLKMMLLMPGLPNPLRVLVEQALADKKQKYVIKKQQQQRLLLLKSSKLRIFQDFQALSPTESDACGCSMA